MGGHGLTPLILSIPTPPTRISGTEPSSTPASPTPTWLRRRPLLTTEPRQKASPRRIEHPAQARREELGVAGTDDKYANTPRIDTPPVAATTAAS